MRTGCSDRQNLTAGFVLQRQRGNKMKTKLILSGALLASLMSSAAFAATDLMMWYHGAGNEVEKKIVEQLITDFNGSQADYVVKLEQFPQAPTMTR